MKMSDPHPHQPQGGMPNGGCHPAHLPVLPFDQFHADPASGHIFAETDGWVPLRNLWLRFNDFDGAGQGAAALHHDTLRQLPECFRSRYPFHLGPILAFVRISGVKQAGVQSRLIGQQYQAFRIGIQPADGVHPGRKPKFAQRPVWRTVARELGNDTPRFVEGQQHRTIMGQRVPGRKPDCFRATASQRSFVGLWRSSSWKLSSMRLLR